MLSNPPEPQNSKPKPIHHTDHLFIGFRFMTTIGDCHKESFDSPTWQPNGVADHPTTSRSKTLLLATFSPDRLALQSLSFWQRVRIRPEPPGKSGRIPEMHLPLTPNLTP